MGFLDYLSPIVGGVSSVVGLIQDGAARQRALQQQQQALQDYGQAADRQYQEMLGNNSRTLFGMAGQGGTALAGLGANLGGALAGAGIYNSSATAGALDLAQRDQGAALADLAARNSYTADAFRQQAEQRLAQMRLGQANTDYGYANAELQGSRQGLGHLLGALATSDLMGGGPAPNPDYARILQQGGVTDADLSSPGSPEALGVLTQANLAGSGANAYRTALPQLGGTLRQGANLPGNAGYGGMAAPSYSGWTDLLDRYTTGLFAPLSGR